MEQKHTPGPWRVEEGTTLVWGNCDPEIMSSYGMGYPVADMCLISAWAHKPDLKEAEANAYLVAAAPDLLRVAELLADWLNEDEGAHKLCDAARAAIAKAAPPIDAQRDGEGV